MLFDNGQKESFVIARRVSTDVLRQRFVVHLLIALLHLFQVNLVKSIDARARTEQIDGTGRITSERVTITRIRDESLVPRPLMAL